MATNQEELLETIGSMTVLELSEFVDAFKDKFNVTAVAAPVAVAGGAGAPGGEAVEDRRGNGVIDRDHRRARHGLASENLFLCSNIAVHPAMPIEVVRGDIEQRRDIERGAGGEIELIGRQFENIDAAARELSLIHI